MNLKDLVSDLANDEIKFLYWCWENRHYLNEMREKLRPGKAIVNCDSGGTIRSQEIFQSCGKKNLDIVA